MKRNKFYFVCLFLFLFYNGFAQKTLNKEHVYSIYKNAYELYLKEKYAPAQQLFLQYINASTDIETSINAKYYSGVCAMELFNADAIAALTEVSENYPEHPKAKLAVFQLGRYFYRGKDNKRAIQYMEQVDPLSLTNEEADEYYFIKGYCYFKTDDFTKSKTAFSSIKDKKNKYYDPANYYYGYVVYKELKYDEAITHFDRIKQSKTFGPLAQVYIAQILFSKKQFESVTLFADSITNKDVADDVAGIVGQSYFYLGKFDKALPYLNSYAANPPIPLTSQDIYRFGYAYFANKNYEKAIEQFTKITDKTDTISQFAHYHLAECYLKTDKKTAARLAFDRAYKIGFNKEITELALFNYAKISYELNQADALKDLARFINDYPESNYIDEARGVLGNLLTSTRNYKQAIAVLESIKKPTESNNQTYQRVLYYYAEELFLNNNYNDAYQMFIKSQTYDFDKKLFALAYFWQAEIGYKQARFSEALKNYTLFLKFEKDIDQTRFFPLAYYNIGYCHIRLEEFEKAVTNFSTFIETTHAQNNPELFTDASMRVADCYFVAQEYNRALDYYQKIITKKLNGSDYALYQKAMIYGVLSKPAEKIHELEQIISGYKKSPYIDDALFEIATVNLETENNTEAIKAFDNIIQNYPRSAYIRKAIQNKGLAQRNAGDDNAALNTFKKLALEHCNSEEARQVLMIVEKIYVDKGETDEYLEFLKATDCKTISATYQDSISFDAAFNQYKNGDCAKSAKLFGQYINRFGGGFFILKANYYKAECDFKLKNFDDALVNYEYVATYNRNDFTERATRQTAYLYYTKKQYRKAFEYYSALERIASGRDNLQLAVTGLMRTTMLAFPVDTAVIYSFKYINSGLTTKEGVLDANLNISRYFMSINQYDSALVGWQYLVKETRNAYTAEAKYNIAFIQYTRKDYSAAKKTIFEISEKYASHATWYEKAFLLLADLYYAQKDNFQAKATLQSLIENLDEGTHKKMATDRLKQIIAEEDAGKPTPKPMPEKEIEKL